MAKEPNTQATVSEPTDQGVGTPSARSSDIALVEIAKIQSDGEYIKRDLNELRSDMREIRDRMSRLEVKVDHLPTKGFIVLVVTTSLVVVGGLLTVAPKLQRLFDPAQHEVMPLSQQPSAPAQQVPLPPQKKS